MRLLVNDLKLYFGLMFLLPLTLAGHKLHLTLPALSLIHISEPTRLLSTEMCIRDSSLRAASSTFWFS